MNKPEEVTRVEVFHDYNACAKYIDYKHNCEIRNFAGKLSGGKGNPNAPYQDFWHFVYDMCEPERDDFFYMDEDWMQSDRITDWQKEILLWFLDEFGQEYGDNHPVNKRNRQIRFWASW